MDVCLPYAHQSCGMLAAVVWFQPIQQQIVQAEQFWLGILMHMVVNPSFNTAPLFTGPEGALDTLITLLTQLFNPPRVFKEVVKGTFQPQVDEPVSRLELI